MTPPESKLFLSALKLLRRLVKKGFGTCKTHDIFCVSCKANRIVEEVEELVRFMKE